MIKDRMASEEDTKDAFYKECMAKEVDLWFSPEENASRKMLDRPKWWKKSYAIIVYKMGLLDAALERMRKNLHHTCTNAVSPGGCKEMYYDLMGAYRIDEARIVSCLNPNFAIAKPYSGPFHLRSRPNEDPSKWFNEDFKLLYEQGFEFEFTPSKGFIDWDYFEKLYQWMKEGVVQMEAPSAFGGAIGNFRGAIGNVPQDVPSIFGEPSTDGHHGNAPQGVPSIFGDPSNDGSVSIFGNAPPKSVTRSLFNDEYERVYGKASIEEVASGLFGKEPTKSAFHGTYGEIARTHGKSHIFSPGEKYRGNCMSDVPPKNEYDIMIMKLMFIHAFKIMEKEQQTI